MLDSLARQMLYPAPAVEVPSPPPPPFTEVRLELPQDAVAVAWALEHPSADATAPAVVFFHGNGENLATMQWAGLYERLAMLGVHFLAVDYPGYGRSLGKPSEASLTAAGLAGFEWLEQRFPERPKVILGWSLGAAVAMQTAARRAAEVDGLVLLSAWDSLESVGAVHFPQWLVGVGAPDRYDSVAAAAEVRAPVLMIHGEKDQLIPIDCGRRLHQAFADGVRFVDVPGAGHNDLMGRPVVWDELQAFVDRVRGAASGGNPPEPPGYEEGPGYQEGRAR